MHRTEKTGLAPAKAALGLLAGVGLAAGASLTQPFRPIASGLGADGPYTVKADSFTQPGWGDRWCYIFRPIGVKEKAPVVFFGPAGSAGRPDAYLALISHMVSRGHALIYAPFRPLLPQPSQRANYDMMFEGFRRAVARLGADADTTRVGFVGHAYGGGAVPAMAWRGLVEQGWGRAGAFLHIMAPWYAFDIEPEQFEYFPGHVNALVQVFEDDEENDPRMAIDIYRSLGMSDDRKAFIILRSDTADGYAMTAGHETPFGPQRAKGRLDALDYHGVFRLLDALSEWTLRGDSTARDVVFGCGGPGQRFMGAWPDGRAVRELVCEPAPRPLRAQGAYRYFWDHAINQRKGKSTEFLDSYRKGRYHFVKKTVSYRVRNTVRRLGEVLDAGPRDNTAGCPAAPIAAGPGSRGPFRVVMDSVPMSAWPRRHVFVFLPVGARAPLPVVFFLHGYTSNRPAFYLPLIWHIVSRGHALVFPTFDARTTDLSAERKYRSLLSGFQDAARAFRDVFDTTRAGFVGHSFGGGAAPVMALSIVNEWGWGRGGSFLYSMAPWYTFGADCAGLRALPGAMRVVVQVFEDDRINDPRIAAFLYRAIGVPPANKRFLVVRGDTAEGCVLAAGHRLPGGRGTEQGSEDALDRYGVFRVFDVLAASAFGGDTTGLGLFFDGSADREVFMGRWPGGRSVRPMLVTQTPPAQDRPRPCLWMWESPRNPWRDAVSCDVPD